MNLTELIGIGRLDKPEPDGYYHVRFRKDDKAILNQISECHLIFDSNRVFFVTVKERKTVENRLYFSFVEDGIAEEMKGCKQATIAMPEADIMRLSADEDAVMLFGYKALYRDTEIGTVQDAMINSLQAVLIIALTDGSELMVPYVHQYVSKVHKAEKKIILDNLDELLAICTSM